MVGKEPSSGPLGWGGKSLGVETTFFSGAPACLSAVAVPALVIVSCSRTCDCELTLTADAPSKSSSSKFCSSKSSLLLELALRFCFALQPLMELERKAFV